MWPFWCGRSGVDVLTVVVWPFWLWPFWTVAVLTCYLFIHFLEINANFNVPYLLVYKPLGLLSCIYEVGPRFEFKPLGAYKRNVLILHFMC